MSAYLNYLASVTEPGPDGEDQLPDEFHDSALASLLVAAHDLHALDPCRWTAAELARLVQRSLTPGNCPYLEER